MKHRYYPILLLYFFQAACMPEEDLPIRHTGETPEYFIECYCQPGRPFALSATSVLPVSEDLQIDFSKEMKVTIHADKAISLIHALYTLPGSEFIYNYGSPEKFEEVVKRAVRSIKEYSENQLDEKYMMVQSGGSHMKVFLKDIVYAEVYNRKVIIHTRDTNIEYYGKLQELSEIAGADFFRTHRAYLVHFKYVQKYDANCVTMENGTALIAKQNYSEFVKQYLKYNQRKGKEIG